MSVQVLTLSQMMRDGKWRLEALHSHDDHLLFWFTKGQGKIVIDGVTRIYGPNAVVFLPAGTAFSIETKAGLFGQVAMIPERPEVPMPATPLHLRVRDLMEHGEFVGLFENLQREASRDLPGQNRACFFHAGLLGVWLERRSTAAVDAAKAQTAAERLTKRYAQLLETRYASGVSVADMAAELGVTATHLTRCCRQTCGRSAHDMLSERLMYEARDLLRRTDLPIKRIALDLGYRSAAYFTRSFQHQIGQTPSDFRKVS
ncbi:MAG: AraC family transcriptional regulator [Pseudomonadota bacterium]